MTKTTKKKALAIAEGLRLLARHAILIELDGGAVTVNIGKYFELDDADAGSMQSMGWFLDAFTGRWCFCV